MNRKKTTNRVGEIELWRALFSLVIMIRHGSYLVGDMNIPFAGGALAVEFFFLVSGYLMMATIAKRDAASTERLGSETLGFVGKKISSFYPEMLLAYIIGFAFECTAKGLGKRGIYELFMQNPFEITMLRMAGFGSNAINGVVWYLQTMIICMMILYPLIRKFPDFMKNIAMPLLACLLLGWMWQVFGHLRDPNKWIGWTFKGNVRGMAELCLGATAYPIAQWLKKFNLTVAYRAVLTAIKWLCWLLVLSYMYTNNNKYDFFYLFVFMLAVILVFSQQGIDAAWYQNKFVYWLGKASLPFFLSHIFFSQNLPLLLPNVTERQTLWVLYFACTIVTSVLVYWGGKGIRKLAGKVKEQFIQMKQADNG